MNFNYSVREKVVQINGIIEIKITIHFLTNNIDSIEIKRYTPTFILLTSIYVFLHRNGCHIHHILNC